MKKAIMIFFVLCMILMASVYSADLDAFSDTKTLSSRQETILAASGTVVERQEEQKIATITGFAISSQTAKKTVDKAIGMIDWIPSAKAILSFNPFAEFDDLMYRFHKDKNPKNTFMNIAVECEKSGNKITECVPKMLSEIDTSDKDRNWYVNYCKETTQYCDKEKLRYYFYRLVEIYEKCSNNPIEEGYCADADQKFYDELDALLTSDDNITIERKESKQIFTLYSNNLKIAEQEVNIPAQVCFIHESGSDFREWYDQVYIDYDMDMHFIKSDGTSDYEDIAKDHFIYKNKDGICFVDTEKDDGVEKEDNRIFLPLQRTYRFSVFTKKIVGQYFSETKTVSNTPLIYNFAYEFPDGLVPPALSPSIEAGQGYAIVRWNTEYGTSSIHNDIAKVEIFYTNSGTNVLGDPKSITSNKATLAFNSQEIIMLSEGYGPDAMSEKGLYLFSDSKNTFAYKVENLVAGEYVFSVAEYDSAGNVAEIVHSSKATIK